jgi:hypothetical protein
MASVVLDGAEEGLEALLEPRYTNIRTGGLSHPLRVPNACEIVHPDRTTLEVILHV